MADYDIPPSHDAFTASIERKFGMAPSALRAFATTLMGDRSQINENFFTNKELELLRQAAAQQIAQGRNSIGYGDYGEKNPWSQGTGGVIDALTDPAKSMAFTLGMAGVGQDPQGNISVNDNYHFAAPSAKVEPYRNLAGIAQLLLHGAANNGLLGVGNVLGNLVAPQDDGRDVKIKIPKSR